MADSAALRTRRSRKHAAGDHSLCIPGRCEALDEADGVVDEPSIADLGLGAAGQRLYDAVSTGRDLPPTTSVVLLEACRIVDRLEQLDRQLHGGDWLRFRRKEDELHVIVHVDRALAEAREQATALRGLLQDIDKVLQADSGKSPAPSAQITDLMERIRAKQAARG